MDNEEFYENIFLSVFAVGAILTMFCLFNIPVLPNQVSWFGGALIDSIIAIIELIIAVTALIVLHEFYYYRKQQRRDAAIRLYGSIKSYLDYINKIKQTPDYYEYDGYYPFKIPEFSSKEPDRYKERPARLILNRTESLKQSIHRYPQIGYEEYKKVSKFFEEIGSLSRGLESSLYKQREYAEQVSQSVRSSYESDHAKQMVNDLELRVDRCSKGINEKGEIIIRDLLQIIESRSAWSKFKNKFLLQSRKFKIDTTEVYPDTRRLRGYKNK